MAFDSLAIISAEIYYDFLDNGSGTVNQKNIIFKS